MLNIYAPVFPSKSTRGDVRSFYSIGLKINIWSRVWDCTSCQCGKICWEQSDSSEITVTVRAN